MWQSGDAYEAFMGRWSRRLATRFVSWLRIPGGVHWLDGADPPELRRTETGHAASGSTWVGLERRHDHVVTGVAALELLPSWLSLPLMLCLILAAWRQESR